VTDGVPADDLIVVAVPCYNEAKRLDFEQFAEFLTRAPCVEFVFVDDGSGDRTGDLLEAFCAGQERASYRSHPTNRGKAEAVRTGIQAAFARAPAFVGYWDADLSTPLDAIPAFQEVMRRRGDIDLVMGARVQLLGRTITRNPVRHYLGRTFATAVSLALGLPVYDTQCGAKLFRATPVVAELFRREFKSRWIFDVEVLMRMTARARRMATPVPVFEYPLEEWRDTGGSRLRPVDFVRAALDLVRIAGR
jgi:dolichyl-phosphate beta-glucosyltransferase